MDIKTKKELIAFIDNVKPLIINNIVLKDKASSLKSLLEESREYSGVTGLHRDDIIRLGYVGNSISDEELDIISRETGDLISGDNFDLCLEHALEKEEIPKWTTVLEKLKENFLNSLQIKKLVSTNYGVKLAVEYISSIETDADDKYFNHVDTQTLKESFHIVAANMNWNLCNNGNYEDYHKLYTDLIDFIEIYKNL